MENQIHALTMLDSLYDCSVCYCELSRHDLLIQDINDQRFPMIYFAFMPRFKKCIK